MKKFEYKRETERFTSELSEDRYLNNMGAQGWELVAVTVQTLRSGNYSEYYWKREKSEMPVMLQHLEKAFKDQKNSAVA